MQVRHYVALSPQVWQGEVQLSQVGAVKFGLI